MCVEPCDHQLASPKELLSNDNARNVAIVALAKSHDFVEFFGSFHVWLCVLQGSAQQVSSAGQTRAGKGDQLSVHVDNA